jgi:hypothetical protein
MNVYRRADAIRPPFEPVQLGFGEHGALNAGNEFSQRADVYADGFSPGGERFNDRGPSTYMGIEDEVARLSEGLDYRTREDRREPRRILVKAMG